MSGGLIQCFRIEQTKKLVLGLCSLPCLHVAGTKPHPSMVASVLEELNCFSNALFGLSASILYLSRWELIGQLGKTSIVLWNPTSPLYLVVGSLSTYWRSTG